MNRDIIAVIKDYFKTKPIEKAWLFGSFSRGEETPESDIDILVTLLPGTRMGLAWFAMICDLEQLTGRKVDLVMDGDQRPLESVRHRSEGQRPLTTTNSNSTPKN